MATTLAKIKTRRGTAAQWASANPVLLLAEKGIETDTKKYKIGDGATSWTSLAYGEPNLAANISLADAGNLYTTKNVEAALQQVGTDIGSLHYTEQNYVDNDEDITNSLDALDVTLKGTNDNIGSRTYTENNYVTDGQTVTASVDALDIGIKDVFDGLSAETDVLFKNVMVNPPTDYLKYLYTVTGYAQSQPMPNNADGQALYKIDGLTAKNEVVNGDFSNGTTGWNQANTAGFTSANNIASFTATARYGSIYRNIVDFAKFKGHKVYFSAKVKADSNITKLYLNDMVTQVGASHTGDGTFQTLKGIMTVSSSATALLVKVQDERASGWTQIQCMDFIVIDMGIDTSNPLYSKTADEMAIEFPFYFDGLRNTVAGMRLFGRGKNLFDKAKATLGKYLVISTGNLGNEPAYFVSDYIRTEAGKTYYLTSGYNYVCLYDKNRNFISGSENSISRSIPGVDGYIRFSTSKTAINTSQLELGSTATPYEPYTTATAYLPNGTLRSVPAIADTVEMGTDGVVRSTKNVSDDKTLATSYFNAVQNNADNVVVYGNINWQSGVGGIDSAVINGTVFSDYVPTLINTLAGTTASDIGKWGISGTYRLFFVFTSGTTLAQAKTALTGAIFRHQLAAPIVTELSVIGDLKAYPNGSILAEPCYSGYATGATTTIGTAELPIKAIRKVESISLDANGNAVRTDISSACTVNTTTLTITGYDATKVYFYDLDIDTKYTTTGLKTYQVECPTAVVTHDFGAGSTAWTLTANENKADMLILTNAGAAFNVVASAQNGNSFVIRNTSGYTATIKTSSTTGVTVANGLVVTVIYNGTDFIISVQDLLAITNTNTANIATNTSSITDIMGFMGYVPADVYGVEVDLTTNSFTRLGGAIGKTAGANFDSINAFGGRKRCIITDTGVRLAYYGETGYTETGALTSAITLAGVTYPIGTVVQVMVEQPKFYYKVVPLTLERNDAAEIVTLAITAGATNSGNVTVTLDGVTTNVAVTAGQTATQVATAIRGTTFSGWTTGGSGTSITFTSNEVGLRLNTTFGAASTGVTSTITRTQCGYIGKGYKMRKGRYYICMSQKEGFKLHPAFVQNGAEKEKIYLSAFEGSLYDVSALAYLLADEQIADFTATTGDKLSSIAGAKPVSGLTQDLTRRKSGITAENRGIGWYQSYAATVACTQLLFTIEYATFNTQTAIGQGVVNKASGSGNESENTGATSGLGNASGMASGTNGLVSISYRGEENFWGNIYNWTDGMNRYDSISTGISEIYISDHSFAESTQINPYINAEVTLATKDGYVSAFAYNEVFDWLFLAAETTGSSALPVGDYNYQVAYSSGYKTTILGGYWHSSLYAGGFYWTLYYAPSDRSRIIGGRLVYIPS